MSCLAIKQSTAVVFILGPALDKTDGVTPETGLASALDHASTGIMLSKNGGAGAVRNGTPTTSVYDAGMVSYRVTLNATDTNTLGTLRATYADAATLLPMWQDFMVLPANVWDSLYGTDKLDVNVEEWNATAVPAEDTAGYPKVTVKDGTGTGEINTNGGKVVGVELVDVLTTYTSNTPQTGDTFTLANGANGFVALKAETAAIVNDTDVIDDATSGLVKIAQDVAAILADTAVIGPTGAGLTSLASADGLSTLSMFLMGLIDDLPTNAELAAALASADDAVLAQVALVKAKTDPLTFTVANVLDANTQHINDVEILGDGSTTPFGV